MWQLKLYHRRDKPEVVILKPEVSHILETAWPIASKPPPLKLDGEIYERYFNENYNNGPQTGRDVIKILCHAYSLNEKRNLYEILNTYAVWLGRVPFVCLDRKWTCLTGSDVISFKRLIRSNWNQRHRKRKVKYSRYRLFNTNNTSHKPEVTS